MANFVDSSSPSPGYDTYAHYARKLIQAFDDKLKGTETLPPNIPRQLTAPLTECRKLADISSVGLVGIPDAGRCSSVLIVILLTVAPVNYQMVSSTMPVGILGAGQCFTVLIVILLIQA
jgi:hypothetical protein